MSVVEGGDPAATIDPDRVRGPLRRLYEELDARVAALGPSCALSGRCCRFREYDHTLFLTAAEAAILVADAPPPARPMDDGATCPWQDKAGRCTAREARPIGCRVYFCDPGYEGQAEPLTEEFLGRLGRLVEVMDLPWGYARLHHHLQVAVSAGRLRLAAAGDGDTEEVEAGGRIAHRVRREMLDISPSGQ